MKKQLTLAQKQLKKMFINDENKEKQDNSLIKYQNAVNKETGKCTSN